MFCLIEVENSTPEIVSVEVSGNQQNISGISIYSHVVQH